MPTTRRVPFEGPDKYNIMWVGEAPGREEEKEGKPFVGVSGQLLERYLNRNMLERSDVMLANLCKYRPSKQSNDFKLLLGTEELEQGISELKTEIKRANPNVIVALGNWPMYYLTGECGLVNNKKKPGTGIGFYRGSRLFALEEFGKEQKVYCSYHPAYIKRVWGYNPIFHLDIGNIVEDSKFPELRYPEYESYIDPSRDKMYDLVNETMKAEWVSVDIETFFNNTYSCVGWAYEWEGRLKGVCVTFQRPDLAHYARDVWASSSPKIFQYGTYDISFMRRFYAWRVGGYYDGQGWDTYVAAASLLPDFPRALHFLTSVYTRMPYYKEEKKVWKKYGDMKILWEYNIKDTITTLLIAKEQMKGIKELFG